MLGEAAEGSDGLANDGACVTSLYWRGCVSRMEPIIVAVCIPDSFCDPGNYFCWVVALTVLCKTDYS